MGSAAWARNSGDNGEEEEEDESVTKGRRRVEAGEARGVGKGGQQQCAEACTLPLTPEVVIRAAPTTPSFFSRSDQGSHGRASKGRKNREENGKYTSHASHPPSATEVGDLRWRENGSECVHTDIHGK